MTDKYSIRKLLEAYLAGSISREQFDELHARLLAGQDDVELMAWMDDKLEMMEEDKMIPVDSEKIFHQITQHPGFGSPQSLLKVRKRQYFYWLSGVAAMICVGITLFLYWKPGSMGQSSGKRQSHTTTSNFKTKSPEGVVLRLADGTEIDLERAENGLLINRDGARVTLKGNELTYSAAGAAARGSIMNSLHIPKGKQFQIMLPDGSKVWLNAASSLTYPVRFSEKERLVEIEGEAYFEIVHDQHAPFIVRSAMQKIEVLGTEFNVSTYSDDGFAKTTLVNGSLRVSREGTGLAQEQSVLLRPGQQSLIRPEDAAISITEADTEEVISWKQGFFVFNDEQVEQVMRKISRWYNVEVEYAEGVQDRLIGGSIPRYDDIHKLMKALQTTGLLHYRMEGGKVVIMK